MNSIEPIYELVNAHAIATYVEEIYSNTIPYLGETLFPRAKKLGLELRWVRGYNQIPISLMPSAFDTKPVLRDRIGFTEVITEMPFFREAMRIGEKDRQNLLMLQDSANPAYIHAEIARIYDDRAQLVAGADVVPERMRMSLIVDGKIDIKAPDERGIVINYVYDYDPSGEWGKRNTFDFTVDKPEKLFGRTPIAWSDLENSQPIQDILDIKRKQSQTRGVTLTRGIMTTATWSLLMHNKSIRLDIDPRYGTDIIMTDTVLQNYLLAKVGITFTIYDKIYKDEELIDRQFYPNGFVTLLPPQTLGNTWFGTTPEEADLMGGNFIGDVAIVNTGVAICSMIEQTIPANIYTSVSEICLPSFERMGDVIAMKVADIDNNPEAMNPPPGDGTDRFPGI